MSEILDDDKSKGAAPKRSLFSAFGSFRAQTSTAAPAPATPMEKQPSGPAKRSKLGRNLIGITLGLFLVVLFVGQIIKQGGSLEDKERVSAAEATKEEDRIKAYDKRVENPEALAERALADAPSALAKPGPQPGQPVPLPADADRLLEQDRERLDAAWKAINAKTGSPKQADAGKSSRSQESGRGEDDQDKPGFVSFAAEKKDKSPNATLAPTAPAAPAGTDAANAVRAQAYALQDAQLAATRQAANQQGQAGTPLSASVEWLQQMQQKPPVAAKAITAQRITGKYVIYPTDVIKAVLEQAVDTAQPGHLRARVTEDIYDSRYRQFKVIPRGSVMSGQYKSASVDGQSRVLMVFDRLITPDGAQLPLGNMSASDALGVAGVPGELHTHFWKRMGIATMLAIEAGLIQKATGSNGTTVSIGGAGATGSTSSGGQIVVNTANQEIAREYAVPPNITIEPGKTITIMATEVLEIQPFPAVR